MITAWQRNLLSAYKADAVHLRRYARAADATGDDRRMAREARDRYRAYARKLGVKPEGVR